jgi:hypothetical protein
MVRMHNEHMTCANKGQFYYAPCTEECQTKGNKCVAKSRLLSGNIATPIEGTLSTDDSSVLGGISLHLTCPLPLDSLGASSPYHGNTTTTPGAPFAVCSENKYEVCETTAAFERVCKFRISVACEEVCVAPRFCSSTEEPRGKLVYRQYGLSHTPSGKACCFKHCKLPQSWRSGTRRIDPTSWCLPLAHEGV